MRGSEELPPHVDEERRVKKSPSCSNDYALEHNEHPDLLERFRQSQCLEWGEVLRTSVANEAMNIETTYTPREIQIPRRTR